MLLFPQVRYAAGFVRSGAIGPVTPRLGRGYGGVPPWSGYPSDPSPFFARGGGPLADMGVYPLHAITGILGPARRVSAFAAQAQESFVDRRWPVRGQARADRGRGQLAPPARLRRRPAGLGDRQQRRARYAAPRRWSSSGSMGRSAVDLLDVSAPVETLLPGEDGTRNAPHERAGGPDHLLGVEHLVECLTTGERPIASIEHAIHVIEIMEAAAASAGTGQAVDLQTTFN